MHMDRVRVGLSGLGAVFLLTLGVSLAFGRHDASPHVAESVKEPGEPLAQLGVAPSSEKQPPSMVPPVTPGDYPVPGDAATAQPPAESPVRAPLGQPAVEATIAI